MLQSVFFLLFSVKNFFFWAEEYEVVDFGFVSFSSSLNLCSWFMQTDNVIYGGAYASVGVDNSVQLDYFRRKFQVEVVRLTKDEMEFDLIGIDPSIANAFRRILIAEVHCLMFIILV